MKRKYLIMIASMGAIIVLSIILASQIEWIWLFSDEPFVIYTPKTVEEVTKLVKNEVDEVLGTTSYWVTRKNQDFSVKNRKKTYAYCHYLLKRAPEEMDTKLWYYMFTHKRFTSELQEKDAKQAIEYYENALSSIDSEISTGLKLTIYRQGIRLAYIQYASGLIELQDARQSVNELVKPLETSNEIPFPWEEVIMLQIAGKQELDDKMLNAIKTLSIGDQIIVYTYINDDEKAEELLMDFNLLQAQAVAQFYYHMKNDQVNQVDFYRTQEFQKGERPPDQGYEYVEDLSLASAINVAEIIPPRSNGTLTFNLYRALYCSQMAAYYESEANDVESYRWYEILLKQGVEVLLVPEWKETLNELGLLEKYEEEIVAAQKEYLCVQLKHMRE